MQTIKTQNIDGYEIINYGPHNAETLIDYEATKKIVNKNLVDTEEHKEIEKKKSELSKYVYQARQAFRNETKAINKSDKRKFNDEYRERLLQIEQIQKELLPLADALLVKRKKMILEFAEYFSLQENNYYISDDEAKILKEKMIEATSNNFVVSRTGELVADFRGFIFWKKINNAWKKSEITKLGEKFGTGFVKYSELSDEEKQEISIQLEKERIENLNATEKEAEKTAAMQGIITRAALMKSELEIQGDKNPLTKAQKWYEDRISEIELKYGP